MYELQRLKRVFFPKQYDHAAWLLINTVGRYWLLLTGWKREYRVEGLIIDLAHPKLRIAVEADGQQWHTDIVHEYDRDERLQKAGWTIRHYRYPMLKNKPKKVRREVRRLYYQVLLLSFFR